MSEKLSIVIPAYNEEKNIAKCLNELQATLREKYEIPYEIIVVNDNSTDDTEEIVRAEMAMDGAIRIVNRTPPGGFGRAIRSGMEAVKGDVVVVYMADLSDSPEDVVAYYRKISEGYDCVFGSRFIKGSEVQNYPPVKLFVNRIVNRGIQLMFWTRFNDLTNAFKAYRIAVIRDCGPYRACHFNLTLEMSLGALIRDYHIAQIPIRWYGRTWGMLEPQTGRDGSPISQHLADDVLPAPPDRRRPPGRSARQQRLLPLPAPRPGAAPLRPGREARTHFLHTRKTVLIASVAPTAEVDQRILT